MPKLQISRVLSTDVSAVCEDANPGRSDGSTSESLKTPSLTSIVDMYRSPSCTLSTPSRSAWSQTYGTFYYDYSENFDNDRPQPDVETSLPQPPLAPIPTRATGIGRATVLNASFDDGFEGLDGCSQIPIRLLSSTLRDELDAGALESAGLPRRESEEDSHDNRPVSTILRPTQSQLESNASAPPTDSLLRTQPGDANRGCAMSPEQKETCDREPPGRELDSARATTTGHSIDIQYTSVGSRPHTGNLLLSGTEVYVNEVHGPTARLAITSVECAIISRSQLRPESERPPGPSSSTGQDRRSNAYSIESGLSDLASMVKNFDNVTAFMDRDDANSPSKLGLLDKPCPASLDELRGDEVGNGKLMTRHISHGQIDVELRGDDGAIAGFRGHRRKFAVPRISTYQLSGAMGPGLSGTADYAKVEVNVFRPKSPTSRLQFQNSAPQPTRPLPSTPKGSVKSESYVADLSADDINLSIGFSPFQRTRTATNRSSLSEISPIDNQNRYSSSSSSLKAPVEGGTIVIHECEEDLTLPEDVGFGSIPSQQPNTRSVNCNVKTSVLRKESRGHKSGNGRLRLRVSRGALVKSQGQSKRVAMGLRPTEQDVSSAFPGQLFSANHDFRVGRVDADRDRERQERGISSTESASASGPTPGTSIVMFSSCLGDQHPDGTQENSRVQVFLTAEAASSDIRSSASDIGSASGRLAYGLKKRFSDLRARVVEGRLRLAELPSLSVCETGHNRSSVTSVKSNGPGGLRRGMGLNGTLRPHSRGLRVRLCGWVRVARRRVMGACAGSRRGG